MFMFQEKREQRKMASKKKTTKTTYDYDYQNMTVAEANAIIARMSPTFLSDAESMYHLKHQDFKNNLMLINKSMYGTPLVKENIDFAIVGSPEEDGYFQFYFMIFEKDRMSPLVLKRLERRKM